MHNEEHKELESENTKYETHDLSIGGLRTASIWFFGFLIFSIVAAYLILLVVPSAPDVPLLGDAPKGQASKLPPAPNPVLQDNMTAITDINTLRQEETEKLTGYGRNEKTGNYKIPVKRAIDILTEKGMPDVEAVPAHPLEPRPAGMERPSEGQHE